MTAALPGVAPIYDDGRLKVYPTPPKQETQRYLTGILREELGDMNLSKIGRTWPDTNELMLAFGKYNT